MRNLSSLCFYILTVNHKILLKEKYKNYHKPLNTIMHFPTSFYITDFCFIYFFFFVTLALGFLCSHLLSSVVLGPCDHLALLPATMLSYLLSPARDKERMKEGKEGKEGRVVLHCRHAFES